MFPNGESTIATATKTTRLTHLATVRGVDLFPPPVTWMPPNCVLEVDDAIRPWTWKEKFDLIHMRIMTASWTDDEWDKVYKQCYE